MDDLLFYFQPLQKDTVQQEIIDLSVHITVKIVKPDCQRVLTIHESNMLNIG